jgi:hypothetical protein
MKQTYQMFLPANEPLTKDKQVYFATLLKKGGVLAIQTNQRLTFLDYLRID